MDKLILIDGNSLTYRAYYGSAYSPRGILKNSKGTPVNAALTLNRMLLRIIDQYNPTNILVAFDKGSKTVRHDKLESYKAGRQKTPQELIEQFPIVREMVEAMGIKYFELENIEADDIIASLAVQNKDKAEVVVVSSDKDLLQLVSDNIVVSLPQNGGKPYKEVRSNTFFEEYGHNPDQVKDFKGLVGDSSDNLPGVQGIGPKGANKLLLEHKSLEGIYENIESIKGSTKDKLIKDKDMALLCKDIATLIFDVKVPYSYEEMSFDNSFSDDILKFIDKYELNSLRNTYSNRAKNSQNSVAKIENNFNDTLEEEGKYKNIIF